MFFLRFLLFVVAICSLPLIVATFFYYRMFEVLLPFIITLIISIGIWIAGWKLFGKKTKIASIVLGLLLVAPVVYMHHIFVYEMGGYIKKTTINGKTYYLYKEDPDNPDALSNDQVRLYIDAMVESDIDESIFIPDTSAQKDWNFLSEEQCKKLSWFTLIERNYPNIYINSNAPLSAFIEKHPDSLLEKVAQLYGLYMEKEKLFLRNIPAEIPFYEMTTEHIVQNFSQKDQEEYNALNEQYQDLLAEIQAWQNEEQFTLERDDIFTQEFLEEYNTLLDELDSVNKNNAGYIACNTFATIGDTMYFEIIRTLSNYLVLSSAYNNSVWVEKTIAVLGEYVQNKETRFFNGSLTEYWTSHVHLLRAFHRITHASIQIGQDMESHIDFNPLITVLTDTDWKNEAILSIQHYYQSARTYIHDDITQLSYLDEDIIDTPILNDYNPKETLYLFQHIMLEELRYIDPTLFPKGRYSHIPFHAQWEVISKELGVYELDRFNIDLNNPIGVRLAKERLYHIPNALGKYTLTQWIYPEWMYEQLALIVSKQKELAVSQENFIAE